MPALQAFLTIPYSSFHRSDSIAGTFEFQVDAGEFAEILRGLRYEPSNQESLLPE
jgi:hypothetical protein